MPGFNISLNNYQNFNISEQRQTRIENFNFDDVDNMSIEERQNARADITKMGIFDKILDLFHCGIKNEALNMFANVLLGTPGTDTDPGNAVVWLLQHVNEQGRKLLAPVFNENMKTVTFDEKVPLLCGREISLDNEQFISLYGNGISDISSSYYDNSLSFGFNGSSSKNEEGDFQHLMKKLNDNTPNVPMPSSKFKDELLSLVRMYIPSFPESKYDRLYPPVSLRDTMGERTPLSESAAKAIKDEIIKCYNENDIKTPYQLDSIHSPQDGIVCLMRNSGIKSFETFTFEGAHGYGLSFCDDAIIKVYSKTDGDSDGLVNGKNVILQQATRGCTAGVSAMLILDNAIVDEKGKKKLINLMSSRNISETSRMLNDLTAFGLEGKVSCYTDISALSEGIEKLGSSIVTVNSGNGSHVIIVDDIKSDAVTIRDPAHGWMVDISKDVFIKAWFKGNDCIQVKK